VLDFRDLKTMFLRSWKSSTGKEAPLLVGELRAWQTSEVNFWQSSPKQTSECNFWAIQQPDPKSTAGQEAQGFFLEEDCSSELYRRARVCRCLIFMILNMEAELYHC